MLTVADDMTLCSIEAAYIHCWYHLHTQRTAPESGRSYHWSRWQQSGPLAQHPTVAGTEVRLEWTDGCAEGGVCNAALHSSGSSLCNKLRGRHGTTAVRVS